MCAVAVGLGPGCGAGEWLPMTTEEWPCNGTSHVAVWTGAEMLIWGGAPREPGCDIWLDHGAAYDPEADRWRAAAADGPFMTRPHVVWTGSEMIVWGGCDVCFNAYGARYDPVLEEWSYLPSEGAPLGSGTAVWTGSELIVWGGVASGRYQEPGGARYSPATDTWRSMASLGAPEPRFGHSAVWTGTEMIIWGGIRRGEAGETIGLVTGGRYDPVTDTWTPTSLASVPEARSEHTTIWTGLEMIVWGGIDYGEPHERPRAGEEPEPIILLDGGGRYDPDLDVWRPVTPAHAPRARDWHAAVWTGTDMVVWGGLTDRFSVRTGGAYDPVADRWRPLVREGAPGPALLHTAVWTGTEMIVWGPDRMVPGARWRP